MSSFNLTAPVSLIPGFPVGVAFGLSLDFVCMHILNRHVFGCAKPNEQTCLKEILTEAVGQNVYVALTRYANPDAEVHRAIQRFVGWLQGEFTCGLNDTRRVVTYTRYCLPPGIQPEYARKISGEVEYTTVANRNQLRQPNSFVGQNWEVIGPSGILIVVRIGSNEAYVVSIFLPTQACEPNTAAERRIELAAQTQVVASLVRMTVSGRQGVYGFHPDIPLTFCRTDTREPHLRDNIRFFLSPNFGFRARPDGWQLFDRTSHGTPRFRPGRRR